MATERVVFRLELAGSLKDNSKATADGVGDIGDAAKRAKRDVGDASQALEKFGGVGERVGSMLGGVWGDLADVTLDLGGRVSDLVGEIGGMGGAAVMAGGAIGIMAAAVGIATVGVASFVSNAAEAHDRLVEIGVATENGAPGLKAYVAASDELSVAWDRLASDSGEALSGRMVQILNIATKITNEFRSMTTETDSASARWRMVQYGGPTGLLAAGAATGAGWLLDRYGGAPEAAPRSYTGGDFGPGAELAPGFSAADRERAAREAAARAAESARLAAKAQAESDARTKAYLGVQRNLAPTDSFLAATGQYQYTAAATPIPAVEAGRAEYIAAIDRNTAALEASAITMEEADRAKMTASNAQTANVAASILGGGSPGTAIAMAAGGPMGAIAGVVADQIANGALVDTLGTFLDAVMAIYTDLPETIAGLADTLVPRLIEAAAPMTLAFVALTWQVPMAIIAGLDDIAASMINAILAVPKLIADELADVINKVTHPFDGSLYRRNDRPSGRGLSLKPRGHDLFSIFRREQGSYGLGHSTEALA